MSTVDDLRQELDDAKMRLNHALWKQFDAKYGDKVRNALLHLELSTQYAWHNGDLISWVREPWLAEIPQDDRDAFSNWTALDVAYVDWANDCLTLNRGDDFIAVQDFGRGAGIYQSHKLIIDAEDCRAEDGTWDDAKASELIEAHMKRSRVYPDVVGIDSSGEPVPYTLVSEEKAR